MKKKYSKKTYNKGYDYSPEIAIAVFLFIGISYLFSNYTAEFSWILVVIAVVGIVVIVYFTYISVKKFKYFFWKEKTLAELRVMDPFKFEHYIAGMFTKMGYSATVTKSTGDFGADIELRKNGELIVVQCKRFAKGNNVGSPDLQKAQGSVAAYRASRAICVTTADYTVQAREYAGKVGMELINGDILAGMIKSVYNIKSSKPNMIKLISSSLIFGFNKK